MSKTWGYFCPALVYLSNISHAMRLSLVLLDLLLILLTRECSSSLSSMELLCLRSVGLSGNGRRVGWFPGGRRFQGTCFCGPHHVRMISLSPSNLFWFALEIAFGRLSIILQQSISLSSDSGYLAHAYLFFVYTAWQIGCRSVLMDGGRASVASMKVTSCTSRAHWWCAIGRHVCCLIDLHYHRSYTFIQ